MIKYILIAAIIFLVIIFVFMRGKKESEFSGIRYSVIGDSYSNGEGASLAQSWPSLLAAHLTKDGKPTKVVSNPSVTGWTSQQAIDQELPEFESSHPTFATLQIGVNDWVQGVSAEKFHANLRTLLDRMQAVLPDKSKLLLVTIPDFGVTPTGAQYSNGRDISAGITEFNDIIKSEAAKRNLKVVDIFELSNGMKDPSLTATDGLHPSANEYILWEKLIYPTAALLLK